MLRCPHCLRGIAHKDNKGGIGFILLSRYLRIVPAAGRILVACRGCGRETELRAVQLVVEERVAR